MAHDSSAASPAHYMGESNPVPLPDVEPGKPRFEQRREMNSNRAILAFALAVSMCSVALAGQAKLKANPAAKPDLRIQEFQFPPTNDKALRVRVVNSGNAGAGPCILRLTVRKINGTPVGRTTQIKLPPLAAGADEWFVIDAAAILPKSVALESTTFRLNVDATKVVVESNEKNNEVWHNL